MSGIEALAPVPWETRNLGRPSFEVTPAFARSPSASRLVLRLQEEEKEHGEIFVQCRTSGRNRRLLGALRSAGFRPAETSLVPWTRPSVNRVFKLFQKNPGAFLPMGAMPRDFTVAPVPRSDLPTYRGVESIARGAFSEDRFHRDPLCPPRTADRRFIFWIRDLRKDPHAALWILREKGRLAAFFFFRGGDLVLNASRKGFRGRGLGRFAYLSVFSRLDPSGRKILQSRISANNRPARAIYRALGFKFKTPEITCHYWSALHPDVSTRAQKKP